MARFLLDTLTVSLVVSFSHQKLFLRRYFSYNTLHSYQQTKSVSFKVILQRMKCQNRNLSITVLECYYSSISCINISTEN